MEWITLAALVVVVVFILALLVLRTKRDDTDPVPGLFDFDGYKERELSRRGVFDKTKWR